MSDLYVAKEAAKICELYSDHIDHLSREHMDMTGALGSKLEHGLQIIQNVIHFQR